MDYGDHERGMISPGRCLDYVFEFKLVPRAITGFRSEPGTANGPTELYDHNLAEENAEEARKSTFVQAHFPRINDGD